MEKKLKVTITDQDGILLDRIEILVPSEITNLSVVSSEDSVGIKSFGELSI